MFFVYLDIVVPEFVCVFAVRSPFSIRDSLLVLDLKRTLVLFVVVFQVFLLFDLCSWVSVGVSVYVSCSFAVFDLVCGSEKIKKKKLILFT